MRARVAVLLGRTSDRSAEGARGAQALGDALGARLGVHPQVVGEPGPVRDARWQDDLRDGRAAIEAAGATLAAALDAGELPVLVASDCSVAMGTLPVLARRDPDARVVWLDAHGDFNTPETTASGYLGGMCLAAACGRWDDGIEDALDPAHVVLSDARDLDEGERRELAAAGVTMVPPAAVAGEVRGERVFLHLDLDVLDADVMPFAYPAPHGLSAEGLHSVLAELASAADLVGVEVTSVAAQGARRVVELLEPVLAP